MSLFVVDIPVPLSLNNIYRNRAGHGRQLTEEAKAYKRQTILIVQNAAQHLGWYPPQGVSLEFRLILHFADMRRTDVDNRIKIALDAVAEALGFDDCCVDLVSAERGSIDRRNPHATVVLKVYEGCA